MSFGVNAPVKDNGNPLLETGTNTATWDHEKLYVSVIDQGSTLHAWYKAATTAGVIYTCYATSTDGVTFTKPNLGLVSFDASTNNNIVSTERFSSAIYDDVESEWVIVSEDNAAGTANGVRIFTTDDPANGLTLAKYLDPTEYAEGRSVMRLADGRWVAYWVSGHAADRRSVRVWISDTADLTGDWTYQPTSLSVFTSVAATRQFYGFSAQRIGDLYYGFVMIYDSTTEQITFDLYVSRDGFVWVEVMVDWLPLGGAWEAEMVLTGSSLVQIGDDWVFYYCGSPEDHATFPRDSRIGRALVPVGRVGQVDGTGSVVTSWLAPTAGAVLSVNADASGGGSLDIEVLGGNGQPLPGFAAADFDTITTDTLATTPTWNSVPMPVGELIQLRFVLDSATLYSYSIS